MFNRNKEFLGKRRDIAACADVAVTNLKRIK